MQLMHQVRSAKLVAAEVGKAQCWDSQLLTVMCAVLTVSYTSVIISTEGCVYMLAICYLLLFSVTSIMYWQLCSHLALQLLLSLFCLSHADLLSVVVISAGFARRHGFHRPFSTLCLICLFYSRHWYLVLQAKQEKVSCDSCVVLVCSWAVLRYCGHALGTQA